jgi:hypothetical protein
VASCCVVEAGDLAVSQGYGACVAPEEDVGGSPPAQFLFDVARELVDAESKRDDAANARAIAVVALSGVMLALTATVSASVVKVGIDRGWRVAALVLLTVAIAALGAAAATALFGVLRPSRFAMLASAEVKKFTTAEYLDRSDATNRQVLLAGMVDIVEQERGRSARKAAWLRRSYALILVAVVALAIAGVLGVFRAAGIIPAHGGHRPEPARAAVVRAGVTQAQHAAEGPSPAPADRVRRERSA